MNGFNLGWYWPDKGPQMTLFIPGPLLRPGDNELLLLEMHRIPDVPAGANFHMPASLIMLNMRPRNIRLTQCSVSHGRVAAYMMQRRHQQQGQAADCCDWSVQSTWSLQPTLRDLQRGNRPGHTSKRESTAASYRR